MDNDPMQAREMADVALVHVVRRRISAAAVDLAARPFDDDADAQMRRALAERAAARAALTRLSDVEPLPSGRPRLTLVTDQPGPVAHVDATLGPSGTAA